MYVVGSMEVATNVQKLAMFLVKWKCDQPLGTMGLLVESAARRGVGNGIECFNTSAIARHDDNCCLVLQIMKDHVWSPPVEEGALRRGVSGKSAWDPAFSDWSVWSLATPWQYTFALSRAYGDGGTATLSAQFRRYLRAVQAS
jgi:hypothetical protein